MTVENSQRRDISVKRDVLSSTLISGNGNQIHIYNYQLETTQDELKQDPSRSFSNNPYKGIDAFQEEDEARYYGRETQITKVWEQFQRLYENSSEPRFLTLYGPSGCGKSSLVRAGLLPEFAKKPLRANSEMKVVVFNPGSHPLEYLALLLARIVQKDPSPVKKAKEYEEVLLIRNENGVCEGLRRVGASFPDIEKAPLVIVVDQFEEIYTQCADKDIRQCFIDNLIEAASDPSRHVSIVITLRSDFLEETQGPSTLNQLIADAGILIRAMSPSELEKAIMQPAADEGYQMDAATVQLLIKDTVGKEGALPLLQFALQQIWEGLAKGIEPGSTLKHIDGVEGALARRAQGIYKGLPSEEQEIARYALVNLVRLEEGTKDTRRRRLLEDLVPAGATKDQVKKVLRRFAEPRTRMITLASGIGTGDTAEITHETLIDNWDQLREWLNEDRKDLRFRLRLENTVKFWDSKNRPEGSLWRSPDLEVLERYRARNRKRITQLEEAFWKESKAAQTRERRRRKQRMQFLSAGLVAMTLAAVFSLHQLRIAFLWRVRNYVAVAEALLEDDPVSSLPNAIAASSLEKTFWIRLTKLFDEEIYRGVTESGYSWTTDALLRRVNTAIPEHVIFDGYTGAIEFAAFSQDRLNIIGGDKNGNVIVFSLKEREKVRSFKVSEDEVTALQFSPVSQRIVSAHKDGSLRLWDINGNLVTDKFNGQQSSVGAVAFSPDGMLIASGGDDNTVKIWSLDGEPVGEAFTEHKGYISAVAFSPDGKFIVSSSGNSSSINSLVKDNAVHVSNTEGSLVTTLSEGEAEHVTSIAFSAEGDYVFGGDFKDTVYVWNLVDGKLIKKMESLDEVLYGIRSIELSPDGQYIAGTGRRTIQIWDRETGNAFAELTGHSPTTVAYSEDGSYLLSGGTDKTVRLWSLNERPVGASFEGHEGWVGTISFSPDGKTIASSGRDGTIRLWDLDGNPIEDTLEDHSSYVTSLRFTPDGKYIVSGGDDAAIRIQSIKDTSLRTVLNVGKSIRSMDISSTGTHIAWADDTGSIQLWNVDSNTLENSFHSESSAGYKVEFSSDGAILAESINGGIQLWSMTGDPIGEPFIGHEGQVNDISFSPDDRYIATVADDQTVKLWDRENQKLIKTFRGHTSWVTYVEFSPDGKLIASGSDDGTARLWNLKGELVSDPIGGYFLSVRVKFSPDGQYLLTGSADGTLALLPVDWSGWLPFMCKRFAHHPGLTEPTTPAERDAASACRAYW